MIQCENCGSKETVFVSTGDTKNLCERCLNESINDVGVAEDGQVV